MGFGSDRKSLFFLVVLLAFFKKIQGKEGQGFESSKSHHRELEGSPSPELSLWGINDFGGPA